jgi:rhodanese-related sulfurtransferase
MFEEIFPKEVNEQLTKGVALNILDVREPGEYASGHIPGAKLFPLGQIPGRFGELDRNLEYVVVCRSGGRSGLACEWLSSQGFKVKNMIGGMMSWPGQVE